MAIFCTVLGKLKLAFFKNLLKSNSTGAELNNIKNPIFALYRQETDRMLKSAEEAHRSLGCGSPEDERLLRAISQEHPSLLGESDW